MVKTQSISIYFLQHCLRNLVTKSNIQLVFEYLITKYYYTYKLQESGFNFFKHDLVHVYKNKMIFNTRSHNIKFYNLESDDVIDTSGTESTIKEYNIDLKFYNNIMSIINYKRLANAINYKVCYISIKSLDLNTLLTTNEVTIDIKYYNDKLHITDKYLISHDTKLNNILVNDLQNKPLYNISYLDNEILSYVTVNDTVLVLLILVITQDRTYLVGNMTYHYKKYDYEIRKYALHNGILINKKVISSLFNIFRMDIMSNEIIMLNYDGLGIYSIYTFDLDTLTELDCVELLGLYNFKNMIVYNDFIFLSGINIYDKQYVKILKKEKLDIGLIEIK